MALTPEDEAELRDTRSLDDAWFDANEAGRKRLEARVAELESQLAALKDVAERAVVAVHIYKHAGLYKANFHECRKHLCGDWHSLQTPKGPPP